jgi:hypothetical protein
LSSSFNKMAALFFQLVVAFALFGMVVVGFMPTARSSTRFAGKLMMADLSSLEAKIAARAEAKNAKVEKKVEKKVVEKKAAPAPSKTATVTTARKTSPVVAVTKKVSKNEVFAPLSPKEVKVVAPVQSVAAPSIPTFKSKNAPVAQKVVSVAPTAPDGPLSSTDALVGVGLGLAPFLLLPGLLLKGINKAKPLPVEAPSTPKVSVFDAPLLEGAKEGIAELFSGAKTEELELSRKGLALSAAGFATAAAFTAALFAGAGGPGPEKGPASAPAAASSGFSFSFGDSAVKVDDSAKKVKKHSLPWNY